MGDVVVVPLDALGERGLPAQPVHLRPAGDPRLDPVAVAVADDVLPEQLDELGALGARADRGSSRRAARSAAGAARPARSGAGSARRRCGDRRPRPPPARCRRRAGTRARWRPRRPSWPARRLAPGLRQSHRAELVEVEHLAVAADAALAEEHRPGRAQRARRAPRIRITGESTTSSTSAKTRSNACLSANCSPCGSTVVNDISGSPPTVS